MPSLSTIVGNDRCCQLKDADGAACPFRRPRQKYAAFANHILNAHIGLELEHSLSQHKDYAIRAYQRGRGLKTGSNKILRDILEA